MSPKGVVEPPVLSTGMSLTAADLVRLALLAVVLGLLYLIFHRLAAPVAWKPEKDISSTLVWMVRRWYSSQYSLGNVYYFLGWAIPLTGVFLVWRDRAVLSDSPRQTWWPALVLITGLLVVHWVGIKTEHHRLSVLAMLGLIWTVPLFLCGIAVARRLIFPCSLLVLLVPWNFLDTIFLKVRAVEARIVAMLLNGLGVTCQVQGFRLVGSENKFSVALDVAAAGVGSMVVLLFLAGLYAHAVKRRCCWWRWVVWLSSGPAFVVAQVVIMTGAGLVAGAIGTGTELKWPADLQIVFIVSLSAGIVVGFDVLMHRNWSAVTAGKRRQ